MTWFLAVILINILIVAVVGGVAWFVAKRVYQFTAIVCEKICVRLNKPIIRISGKWFGIVYTVLAIPLFLAFMPLPIPLGMQYALRVFGAYWAGVFVYLFMLLLFAELLVLSVKIIYCVIRKYKPSQGEAFARPPLHKKVRQWATVTACCVAVLVSTFGFVNARHLHVAIYEIELSTPLSGEPMTIVFISDLHLGEVHTERWLPRIVRGINALEPDVVAIIGDIFNDDFYLIRNPQQAIETLSGIESTFGVFACLGNHDAGPTVHSMINFLEESNITLLNCGHIIIDERLVLIGRVDPSPSNRSYGFGEIERRELEYVLEDVRTELNERSLPELPIVVIDHNPLNINEYGSEVDLVLFGHTHRGQFFPGSLITRLVFDVDHGHKTATGNTPHVIVTQGVHTWLMPMRVGTNNEIGKVVIR